MGSVKGGGQRSYMEALLGMGQTLDSATPHKDKNGTLEDKIVQGKDVRGRRAFGPAGNSKFPIGYISTKETNVVLRKNLDKYV